MASGPRFGKIAAIGLGSRRGDRAASPSRAAVCAAEQLQERAGGGVPSLHAALPGPR